MSHTNVLDSIDGAVRAHELSADAMRWVPGGERTSERQWVSPRVQVTIDTTALSEAFQAIARGMEEAIRSAAPILQEIGASWKRAVESAYPFLELAQEMETDRKRRLRAMHHTYRHRSAARRRARR